MRRMNDSSNIRIPGPRNKNYEAGWVKLRVLCPCCGRATYSTSLKSSPGFQKLRLLLFAHLRVGEPKRSQSPHDHPCDNNPSKPFMISGYDIPWCPVRACVADCILIGFHVRVPVRTLLQVGW